jgi:hypothetical protein
VRGGIVTPVALPPGRLMSVCVATILGRFCPLWVISRHRRRTSECPIRPESGHWLSVSGCPLCARSGHQAAPFSITSSASTNRDCVSSGRTP